MRKTLLDAFFEGTERTPYPKDLGRIGGSVAGRVRSATVVLDVYPSHIHLVRLYVARKDAGNGYARETLRWLCMLASTYCLDIKLHPIPFSHKSMNEQQLIEWYRRCGFTKRGIQMIRKPY